MRKMTSFIGLLTTLLTYNNALARPFFGEQEELIPDKVYIVEYWGKSNLSQQGLEREKALRKSDGNTSLSESDSGFFTLVTSYPVIGKIDNTSVTVFEKYRKPIALYSIQREAAFRSHAGALNTSIIDESEWTTLVTRWQVIKNDP